MVFGLASSEKTHFSRLALLACLTWACKFVSVLAARGLLFRWVLCLPPWLALVACRSSGRGFTIFERVIFMQKACLDSLPDVLCAKDVAAFLGIGYVKALKLLRYGGMNTIQIGKVYRVSKRNFTDWLNCEKPVLIELD